MTKVRGSERSGLDKGEVADWRSNRPMNMAIEMAMAVTSIAAETSGEDTLEPMDRNENGKRRWRSQVPATAWALGDWRSWMERVAQHQARELTQLHQTVAEMANMQVTHTALQEAQWREMKLWLKQKEKMQNMYHQDDLLCGKSITDMVPSAVAATERDQNAERKVDTKRVGLEASIHADLT